MYIVYIFLTVCLEFLGKVIKFFWEHFFNCILGLTKKSEIFYTCKKKFFGSGGRGGGVGDFDEVVYISFTHTSERLKTTCVLTLFSEEYLLFRQSVDTFYNFLPASGGGRERTGRSGILRGSQRG
jgi:hypothetical protein